MSAAAEASRSSALESPPAVAEADRPARGGPLTRALDGHVLPLAALALVALVLHGSGLVGGPLAYERDTYLFYYPLTTAFAAALRAGHLPFWLPTTFAGYPLLADGEVGPLYPLNLLVLPLAPTDLAFAWLRAIHTATAGWLTYFFLRRLGSSGLGALAAGLVFSLGSFLVGQQQHENMIRSAVWLPGELLCFESALRARSWRRQQLFVLGGVVLGIACLGLHIQAIGMSILALGLYALWRVFDPGLPLLRRERPLVLFWGPGLMLAVALGLSAAQWLPLTELGRTSFRGPGLRYDLATTYSLAPINLASLVFPYLFRGADGVWWSLWSPWETLTYAGVPTLLLAAVAVLTTWRRGIAWYFAALAVVGLWIAMSHYAPFNLHELLWRLPGFSSLRAPGRFGFLTVLGLAGLAAFGLDALVVAASRSSSPGRWVQRLPWS
ncbi:MAG: hypothetical protein IT307_01860, partial [Chloroflexi bacterium]|nr:hypothetical protein [Chloroflexota bacterium]